MATASWSIQRIERQAPSDVELECLTGEYPVTVTLYDKGNDVYETTTFCTTVDDPNPCTLLGHLTSAGYTPNDWWAECS